MQYEIELAAPCGKLSYESETLAFIASESVENAFAEMTFSFPDWEKDTYVFMPACADNGTQKVTPVKLTADKGFEHFHRNSPFLYVIRLVSFSSGLHLGKHAGDVVPPTAAAGLGNQGLGGGTQIHRRMGKGGQALVRMIGRKPIRAKKHAIPAAK